MFKTFVKCNSCNKKFNSKNKLFRNHLHFHSFKCPAEPPHYSPPSVSFFILLHLYHSSPVNKAVTFDFEFSSNEFNFFSVHFSVFIASFPSSIVIFKIMFKSFHDINYVFCDFCYAICKILAEKNKSFEICINNGNPINLMNKKYLISAFSHFKISRMGFSLPIKNIDGRITHIDEIATIKLCFLGQRIVNKQNKIKKFIIICFEMKLHILKNLSVNIVFDNDILVLQEVSINFVLNRLKIGACKGIEMPLSMKTRNNSPIQRNIRNKIDVVVLPDFKLKLPVIYKNELFNNRDFFFEFNKLRLKKNGGLYAHLINHILSFVQIKNVFTEPIMIRRRVVFGKIVKFNENGFYAVNSKNEELTIFMQNCKTIEALFLHSKKNEYLKRKKESALSNIKLKKN